MLESLLFCTSILERSLGDLFATASPEKPVPSLLRDLATSEEVAQCLGQELSVLLESVFGGPRSLNLRNLAWHGFLHPGEVHPRCLRGLVFLAHLAGEKLAQDQVQLVRRPLRSPLKIVQQSWNPDQVRELAFSIPSIPVAFHRPLLQRCRQLYIVGKHLEAAVLALPQLESMLRFHFARINGRPERVLTAESDTLYTTVTEMMSPWQDDEETERNRLLDEIDQRLLALLLDVLVMPEGPRIRDRLSHGEVPADDDDGDGGGIRSWCEVVGVIYGAVVEDLAAAGSGFMDLVARTKPKFHPSALLLEEAGSAVNACSFLLKRDFCYLAELEVSREHLEKQLMVASVLDRDRPLYETIMRTSASEIDRTSSISRSDFLLGFVHSFHPPVLFRGRSELSVVSLLRRLAATTKEFLSQAAATVAAREAALAGGNLGRRLQNTYRKMLMVLGPACGFLLDVVAFGVATLATFRSETEEDGAKKALRKEMRRLLSACENLCSCTNPERNDWTRAAEIISQEEVRLAKMESAFLS